MSVPRTVRFWQITAGAGPPLEGLFPATVLAAKLAEMDVAARRFDAPDGWHLFAQTVSTDSNPHLCLYRIRHENLPSIEQAGELKDLELADDQNLAEGTHFRFFPRNVVAQLFNHDGPQIQRLIQYLRNKTKIDVSFAPVLRQDIAKTLNRLTDITSVEMTVPVNKAYLLEGDDGDETIKALREFSNKSLGKTVHIKSTVWGSPEPSAPTKWMQLLKKITSSEMFLAFSALKVRAWDTEAKARQTIDLIAEQLTMTEDVELRSNVGRAVKDESAAAALQDSYTTLEAQIKASVPAFPPNVQSLSLDDLSLDV